MHRLRHLVCGTDFSDCAGQALEMAIGLASVAGAEVTVVHVCEPGVDDLDDGSQGCVDALGELVARHRRACAGIHGVLRSGRPWEKLDNVAAEVGADLIVVSRGRPGRARERGSVADPLVRCASRPVLIVPCDLTGLEVEASGAIQPCGRKRES